jgi:hypothetical protein
MQPELEVSIVAVLFDGIDDVHHRTDGNAIDGLLFNSCCVLHCHDFLLI